MGQLLSLIAALLVTTPWSTALAQSKKDAKAAEKPAAAKEEKIDVSDLEKKYWSAKDTDFSVVQNRLYTKAGRISASLVAGSLINESWSTGPTLGLNINYYLSEKYGVQFTYQQTNSSDNDAVQRLTTQGGTPNHGLVKGFYGFAFNWIPLYGKMSFIDSKILYFDLSVSPGLGLTRYEQQREQGPNAKSAPTFSLDISQQFFFTQNLAIRVDFINRWWQEEVVWYRISSQNLPNDNSVSRTSAILFGATFFF